MKNDLCTAKQNKFAKVNSTHGKGHQKEREKYLYNGKAQCSSKMEHKKIASHEGEIE